MFSLCADGNFITPPVGNVVNTLNPIVPIGKHSILSFPFFVLNCVLKPLCLFPLCADDNVIIPLKPGSALVVYMKPKGRNEDRFVVERNSSQLSWTKSRGGEPTIKPDPRPTIPRSKLPHPLVTLFVSLLVLFVVLTVMEIISIAPLIKYMENVKYSKASKTGK